MLEMSNDVIVLFLFLSNMMTELMQNEKRKIPCYSHNNVWNNVSKVKDLVEIEATVHLFLTSIMHQ